VQIFRICKVSHAATAFSGEGARRYAGRWHEAGTPIVYCSASRALAALEQLVHLQTSYLPPHFVCFAVGVPARIEVERVELPSLPPGWRAQPAPAALRAIGTRWFRAGTSACLELPSAIIPAERNTLLNPRHPDFAKLVISEPEAFEFDERLAPARRSRVIP
jgi:RES domain-containing protein